jgi:hypothetical protein
MTSINSTPWGGDTTTAWRYLKLRYHAPHAFLDKKTLKPLAKYQKADNKQFLGDGNV